MSLLRNTTTMPSATKPARRGRLGALMVAGGMTAAFVVADGAAMMSSASAAPNLAGLRACESGGNYSTSTGNGYYGAYQFSASTWHSLGLSGLPNQASPAQQDAAVLQLASRSGWAQWPVCSIKAGSSGTSSAAAAPARASRSSVRAPLPARTSSVRVAPKAAVKVAPKAVATSVTIAAAHPAFPINEVIVKEQGHYRPEVRAWQARMAQRGWTIAVDGLFGPQSSSVAAAFAAEKGLPGTPGSLDQAIYNGAWSLKIT